MNSKFYKYCVVPMCNSTTKTAPNKLFIHVPNEKSIRKKWFMLARRDLRFSARSNRLYFCEDHFDLPSIMKNYMEFKIMGNVRKICLIPGSLPTKFDCQVGRKRSIVIERPCAYKRRIKSLLDDALNTPHLLLTLPQPPNASSDAAKQAKANLQCLKQFRRKKVQKAMERSESETDIEQHENVTPFVARGRVIRTFSESPPNEKEWSGPDCTESQAEEDWPVEYLEEDEETVRSESLPNGLEFPRLLNTEIPDTTTSVRPYSWPDQDCMSLEKRRQSQQIIQQKTVIVSRAETTQSKMEQSHESAVIEVDAEAINFTEGIAVAFKKKLSMTTSSNARFEFFTDICKRIENYVIN